LDNLFANAPAQYRAMNSMFIDPFTGAAPRNAYNATPMQSSQMMSGGGGGGQAGFVDQAHADRMAQMSSTGRHYGVNSQYNPYAGSMMTDSSGALVDSNGDGVTDYRDMSFGEDGRRQIGDVEKYGNMLFGGIPRIIDGVQGSLFDMSGAGYPSMSQAELVSQMNEANARYEARLQADRQRALDVALAQQEQEDLIAAGLIENPISNAVTTPYVAPVVRTGGGNGGPKGDNSFGGSGNGFGASSKSGSTSSGQTDYGFF
jgi:hypothetical protein